MADKFRVVAIFEDGEDFNEGDLTAEEKAIGTWSATAFGADCDMGELTVAELAEKIAFWGHKLSEDDKAKLGNMAGEKVELKAGRWGHYQVLAK
ncbi:MAG: hypothetical protein ABSF90_00610 [Syntrophobacteraceae bacterium]|jgi:hypothetical protein